MDHSSRSSRSSSSRGGRSATTRSSASTICRSETGKRTFSLVVLLALSLPGVVAGSVFVESVFAWPGMGRAMLGAIASRDYPVVLGATVLYAALVIAANLAAELALPRLDPRRQA